MKRLENGLIEGLNYIYDENGRIDWLKMIPEKHLYINTERKDILEKELNKSFSEITIKDVKDTDLIVTLMGIRFLLDTRGYKYVKTKIDFASSEYAAATCEICFIPNIEEGFEQVFTASASAHPFNTKSFYSNYLVEASSNRALCRAVRNYLKLNLLSREELSDGKKQFEPESNDRPTNLSSPVNLLESLLKEYGKNFADLKNKLIEDKVEGADKFESLNDIPKPNLFELISYIKERIEARTIVPG